MGKASKLRSCPATGGTITPAECGEHRHSRHACPADCPFNPFAPTNYEALLADEDRLDDLTVQRLVTEEPDAPAFIDRMAREHTGHGRHAATVWRLFFRRGPDGLTFAGRWARAGLSGLKNDQRVFLRGKMDMRVALLEVQQIVDDRTMLAVDLLGPNRPLLRIVDRQSAARLPRFALVLTWIYPLPHFWRMSGSGTLLPDLGPVSPEDALLMLVRHLGGPDSAGPARALWLAEHFCRMDAAIAATAHERRRLMFSGIDAQFGKVSYALEGTLRKCRQALLSGPDVAEEDLSPEEKAESFEEAWVWFEPDTASGMTVAPKGGRKVRGRVLLGPNVARIEAVGQVRLAGLREDFETRLGRLVRFTAERRDDLGRRMQIEEPAADLSLVPPQLLAEPQQIELQSSRLPSPPPDLSMAAYGARLKIDFLRRLLDESLPALTGKTPRQAAGDLLLRPVLVRIMKNHVRQLDEDNLRSGRTDNIHDILRELGLHEIDFPPPPPRMPPEEDELDEHLDGMDGEPWDVSDALVPAESGRPPAPVLIGPPLDVEQAIDGLDRVMGSLSTAGAGIDEMDRSGATVLADMYALVGDRMSDNEFNYFITFVLQAWFVLVPKGVSAPALRLSRMQDALKAMEEAMRADLPSSPAIMERVLSESRQPGLLQALAGGLLESSTKVPKKMRPSAPALAGMVLGLRVMLDELDRALRPS